jgi:hypothetical protein
MAAQFANARGGERHCEIIRLSRGGRNPSPDLVPRPPSPLGRGKSHGGAVRAKKNPLSSVGEVAALRRRVRGHFHEFGCAPEEPPPAWSNSSLQLRMTAAGCLLQPPGQSAARTPF